MMWIGLLTIAAAAVLYGWYRPRWGEGAKLCVLCFAMGLGGLAAAVAVCCLFCLHREKIRKQRALARRAAKSVSRPAPAGKVTLTVLYPSSSADRGCA